MKIDDRVITKYGPGTIVRKEDLTGILAKRYLVKLDDPGDFADLQKSIGGIYMFDCEMKGEE